ncbi:hypothetical protein [Streptomyces sp. NPDC052015]|uniref:hypothetical protein n=1 Tax=Streptomyces sp. NPDC052015 TaxID=3154755 RepID=UPI0034192630
MAGYHAQLARYRGFHGNRVDFEVARFIVVHPPAADGGRRIRIDDQFVGMAYGLLDVAEFLRRARSRRPTRRTRPPD